jgi:DNA-binding response OmpR family regulator
VATPARKPPVELLPWPAGEERRRALAARDLPRLLLVEEDVAPPVVDSLVEDWIRVPASEQDVAARIERLQLLATSAWEPPVLQDDRLVRFGDRCVALSATQAAVAKALLADATRLVLRDRLEELAGVDPDTRSLDSVIHRLRVRLAPLGVEIIGIRGRGYVLVPADDAPIADD